MCSSVSTSDLSLALSLSVHKLVCVFLILPRFYPFHYLCRPLTNQPRCHTFFVWRYGWAVHHKNARKTVECGIPQKQLDSNCEANCQYVDEYSVSQMKKTPMPAKMLAGMEIFKWIELCCFGPYASAVNNHPVVYIYYIYCGHSGSLLGLSMKSVDHS